MTFLDEVPWNEHELVAAIAQDATSGKVLTVAWMNRARSSGEAAEKTSCPLAR